MKITSRLPLLVLSAIGFDAFTAEPALPYMPVLDMSAIDATADPCTDFYQYACGGWHQKHPMPENESFWSRPFTQFKRQVDSYVFSEITKAAQAGTERTPDEQRVGDYFAACMDTSAIEARGLDPVRADLAIIDSMDAIAALPGVLGQLQKSLPWYPQDGEPLLFIDARPVADGGNIALRVGRSGLGLFSPKYYKTDNARSTQLLKEYEAHIANMFFLIDIPDRDAKRDGKAVLALESALAAAYMPRSEMKDNPSAIRNRMSLTQMQALTPHFNWLDFIRAHGLPDTGDVNPQDIGYLTSLNSLLVNTPLPDWKAYLKWQVISERAKSLPEALRSERSRFYNQVMLGVDQHPERQQTCMDMLKIDLPGALGRMFIHRAFKPEMRDATYRLFEEIKAVMRERVKAADWMQKETVQMALAKIDATRLTVGHPPIWLDDPNVVIRSDDHYGNVLRTGEAMRRILFNRLGQDLDLNWWDEPVTWIGGYYQASYNAIVITAAMMMRMEYGNADPVLTYAGLGTLLAHELIHGFDTGGRKYDANGQINDWWSESDERQFESRAKCVTDQFSAMEYAPGIPVDGSFVVAEQFTEIAAQQISWEAYLKSGHRKVHEKVHGLTDQQRFLIAGAQTWCADATEGGWQSLANGGSAKTWGRPMVHGTVTNLKDFKQAFECKTGQAMVKPPTKVCPTW